MKYLCTECSIPFYMTFSYLSPGWRIRATQCFMLVKMRFVKMMPSALSADEYGAIWERHISKMGDTVSPIAYENVTY